MSKKLFREIEIGEDVDQYLSYIESICRIVKNKKGKCRRVCGSYKTQIYYARLVWNLKHPDDPVLPGSKYLVHHIDGDSMNDRLDNLEKKLKGLHSSDHNKGENNPMFGKTHSEESNRKNSESTKGKNHPMFGKKGKDCPNSKPVVANFIEYPSRLEAARVLGVAPSTITYRIKTNKPGYKYL